MIKKLTALVGVCVAGIVVCLGMTIYTGVKEHQEKNTPTPLTIPTPAIAE
jgi:hypothetical protein